MVSFTVWLPLYWISGFYFWFSINNNIKWKTVRKSISWKIFTLQTNITNWNNNHIKYFRTWHKYSWECCLYERYFAPGVIRLSHPWTFQLPLKWAYNSIPVVTFTWNCMAFIKKKSANLFYLILHRLRAFFFFKQFNWAETTVLFYVNVERDL